MSNPVFVIEDGLIRWDESEVRLTPQEAAALGYLHRRRPHFMAHERFCWALWPGGPPKDPSASVTVLMCKLRRKLAGTPLLIETRFMYGYRLVGELQVI